VNDEMHSMCNVADLAYIKVAGGTEGNSVNLSHDNRHSGTEQNP
jgi:hypothetical protein